MTDQRDYFRTKTCYKLYLYAKSLAEQVNEYIDRGSLVFDEYDGFRALGKFVFEDIHKEPDVAQVSLNSNFRYSVLDKGYDRNGKIWICDEMTKKSIRALFENIRIVHPASIEKINFKK